MSQDHFQAFKEKHEKISFSSYSIVGSIECIVVQKQLSYINIIVNTVLHILLKNSVGASMHSMFPSQKTDRKYMYLIFLLKYVLFVNLNLHQFIISLL